MFCFCVAGAEHKDSFQNINSFRMNIVKKISVAYADINCGKYFRISYKAHYS